MYVCTCERTYYIAVVWRMCARAKWMLLAHPKPPQPMYHESKNHNASTAIVHSYVKLPGGNSYFFVWGGKQLAKCVIDVNSMEKHVFVWRNIQRCTSHTTWSCLKPWKPYKRRMIRFWWCFVSLFCHKAISIPYPSTFPCFWLLTHEWPELRPGG